jgi:hypothetical protein
MTSKEWSAVVAQTASARKVQLTIPPADTTMNEWLDVQYSAADSIRKLIRESVAREGFTDVANRPVRPPANPIYVAEDFPDEPAAPADEPSSTDDEPSARPQPVRKPAPAPAAEDDDVPEPPSAAPSTPTAKTRRVQASDRSAADTIDDILGL